MSNWNYANVVPTTAWRSANTIPRELFLINVKGKPFLASRPSKELAVIKGKSNTLHAVKEHSQSASAPFQLELQWPASQDGTIRLSNDGGEELLLGYERQTNRFFIDRTKAGQAGFSQGFATRHYSARISGTAMISLNLIVDNMSVELFADDGLTVMTDIVFPLKPFTSLNVKTSGPQPMPMYRFTQLKASMPAN
jgi:fructan beta-fructosidase